MPSEFPLENSAEKIELQNLDLRDQWNEFIQNRFQSPLSLQDRFLDYLRTIVADPGSLREAIGFCTACGYPELEQYMAQARDSIDHEIICESCAEEWNRCARCSNLYPCRELTITLDEHPVCESCQNDYYTYCNDCGGYYDDKDAEDHEHARRYDDCCESPQLTFAIRNDGQEPLKSDTQTAVELPSGIISEQGLDQISNYLYFKDSRKYSVLSDLSCLGDEWQTKDGNFAKRLSRHAYNNFKIKLPPEVLSQVGVLARDHSTTVGIKVEVTRQLNNSADYFYHEDSCWWESYSESRCALKTNGGFGMRSFHAHDDYLTGRAWVMPLKLGNRGHLVPTFETLNPDAYAVFNGYGDLSGYAAPRVLAHMTGLTYRRIDFGCEPMYVNASSYIVANEAVAQQYEKTGLRLNVAVHSSLYDQEARREETASVS